MDAAAMRVGDAVYHHRTRLGFSQRELAERAGVSRHTVVNIEAGQTNGVRLGTLAKVFDALGLQVDVKPKLVVATKDDSNGGDQEFSELRERFRKRFTTGGDEDYALLQKRG